jgi:agmatine deiminase
VAPATGPWRMPPEWARHERTWMAWPSSGYTLGDTEEEADAARATWAAVARAVAGFEPVTVVADPDAVGVARDRLTRDGATEHGIDLVATPLDDAWMRDIGPTFVLGPDGGLGAVDWVFNGWGAQDWASWDHDELVASSVADRAGATRIGSDLVNEGGGLHVDGLGTVLLTETVQLDPGRNPGLTRADVDAELARTIGATTCIWLPRGLTRDYDEFGTRGHVDIVATFAAPGLVLLHWQGDPAHPDHAVCTELESVLTSARDARGERLEVVRVPAPRTLEDDHGWVDWSYINHLVVNSGVVACAFEDEQDTESLAILERAYPGRRVVGVDARELFHRGGGIHCITQQQPTA